MTVKKLTKRPDVKDKKQDDLVDVFIMRGGKTTEESKDTSHIEETVDENITRFTIRIPEETVKKIDKKRKKSIGNISRNTWILEAISQRLEG